MTDNKVKKAAALKYERSRDRAPRVIAKGARKIAERIIELAREKGIPITEDPDLVGALMKLDLQEQIPEELYKTVAEILAFAYRINKKMETDLHS
ncbi:MAG: EscU/YscU/HrcU family type III secretion system export apparatus switch protein [Deltaproteobacteria bacterium]|nr:EscU/YscU/HrcU family type III secretion system export apparatus switch protein [Deltaproteobacteria bacterium]